ncbi:hypothetical protein CCACVL1_23226 [Corchorus capsularis]|uniref:Clathrin/coatomer adaptor adaptin-like N-terminal domain-containing protein n=1 Tax=Corchorus capsularis TaxID=210143 RepID=A0A1R3GUN5_COCAP|nr:hypothetical protein CCACVL1_23226 [Corchorus capsularis]
MGRGRGKGKKLTIRNREDAGSGVCCFVLLKCGFCYSLFFVCCFLRLISLPASLMLHSASFFVEAVTIKEYFASVQVCVPNCCYILLHSLSRCLFCEHGLSFVFGNLAKILTGIDVTNLTVSEKLNTTKIPAVVNRIFDKQFDHNPPPIKIKETAQSSADAPHGTQAEINVTPNAEGGIDAADDATPSTTPSESLDDVVSKSSQRSSKRGLTPCQKKNYACKMLYIYMLGYDVDFGHMEAVSLISAPTYPEKQVGYFVTSCLLNENHDFLRLAINTVRDDIIGQNETCQCLALTMVGNIVVREFAESLAPDFQKLLLSSSCRPVVRKKAALCLLQLYRKNPDIVNVDGWADRMAQLLDERDLGVLMSSMSLLVALVSNNHEAYWACLPKCVKILELLVRDQDVLQEYTYYDIPSPLLQVKTMRVLKYFPAIKEPNTRRTLFEVLQRILMGTDVVKNVNKNALHAVHFEAIALVMHLDAEKEMMPQCVALLGKFIAAREPNIRYLGFENMTRMLMVTEVQDIIKRHHQAQIFASLKDPDISICRRALDLLYGMCDVNNAKDIVEKILQHLSTADFAMRKELSLKAAILAEKFSPNLSWYVDVILQLIDKAGDFISDDVWFRVVKFVTNNEDLQPYAATRVKEYLEKPAVHETMVKVSAYILGEYSHLLSEQPGCSLKEIFRILHEKLPTVSTSTIPILLSAYAKILMHTQPPDQELKNQICSIFNKFRYESYIDLEIQQRAVEYFALSEKGAALMDILAKMPKFPERQFASIRKAEDEIDTEEQSAIKLRAQQQTLNALVVTDSKPANTVSGLEEEEREPMEEDTESEEEKQHMKEDKNLIENLPSLSASFERFRDLCVEGRGDIYVDDIIRIYFVANWQYHWGYLHLFFENKYTDDLVSVQVRTLPSSNLTMVVHEPVPSTIPYAKEEKCQLQVINFWPSNSEAVLDISFNVGDKMVHIKPRLPIAVNSFLQPTPVSTSEMSHLRNSVTEPPLKLVEIVDLKRPISFSDMVHLLKRLQIEVYEELDPSRSHFYASTFFYSYDRKPMPCLIRVDITKVDINPVYATELCMTVISNDERLTFEYVAQLHTKQIGLLLRIVIVNSFQDIASTRPSFLHFDDIGTICTIVLTSNACLQAKELHKLGALNDHLLPLQNVLEEEILPVSSDCESSEGPRSTHYRKCQERFSLERQLESLGDAFLMFVVGRHLFLLHGDHGERGTDKEKVSKGTPQWLRAWDFLWEVPVRNLGWAGWDYEKGDDYLLLCSPFQYHVHE